MGNWTEHIIIVTRRVDSLIDRLGDVLMEADESDVRREPEESEWHRKLAAIRLSYDNYDFDKGKKLAEALREAAEDGMVATWLEYSADPVQTYLVVFEDRRGMTLLSIERLIRDTDLALLYAKVENGEESPEELGEAFTDMIPDPDEPEEVEEAFTIAEMLMKHRVVPSDDDIDYWQEVLEALRTALGLEGEDEVEDWKRETLQWLETVCEQTEAE